jgi:parallel beta-helix repeat protein
MKSMKVFTLIIALIAGHYCLLNAQPVISTSPMPANFEIQVHVRNGNSAFEGSLTTPGAPLLQMNPAGDPVWNTNGNQYGNLFSLQFTYTKATGTSAWKIDFNRDGDYSDAQESVTFTDPTLAGKGFRFINIYGQSSAARYIVLLNNLNINGINMGSFSSDSDTPFNALFEDATGGFDNITVSGNFSFSGNGGQERPHIWIKLSTPGAKEVFVNDALTGDDSYTTAAGNDISGNGTASAPYATINKAVSMARDGATVKIDAGIYAEQVMVGKNVNITGLDRAKTIIQAPASLASVTWKSANPIVYVFGNANTVNISKITIDGNNGRNVTSFIGILYYEANGAFTNSRITGIHNAGIYAGDQTGHAYYATHIADATLAQSVSITGNSIDDYQKGGIYVREPGTMATISGNTVTGQNIPGINTQVGIMVMLGASGTVTGNTVSNNILNKVEHPHTNMAAGIWLYKAANCTVGTNTLTGNEIGLTSSTSTGITYNPNTFANNKIQVMLDAAGDVNPGNIYDKNVKNPLKQAVVFGCIQYSIDEAASGNTMNASAGSYVENILVHTPVTLNGPNASINPCSGSRVAEAIVYPAVDSPADWSSTLVDLKANNIVIDGFTFDGDNPAFGGTGNYNVSQGIAGVTGQANILLKNNIIKNMATVAVILADDGGSMTTGNSINNNKIDNINPTASFGIGIYTGNNTYVNITNNCITNVRKGIQGGENNYIANAGNVSPVWSGNAITSYKIGIWNNLAYGTATPVTITGNTVNTVPGSAINSGILISSIGQAASVNVSGNTVTGAMAGINLWNNPTNTPLTIGANTYVNCGYGVFANNFDGYASNAGSSSYLINGGTITNPLLAGIYVKDNSLNTNGATVSVAVAGTAISGTAPGMKAFLLDGKDAFLGFSGAAPQATVTGAPKYFVQQSNGIDFPSGNIDATQVMLDGNYGSAMGVPALLATEDKIDHKIDNPALGFVNVKANNIFVTANSYIAPATTSPSIQRAIDFASAGFTVHVGEGTFAENVIVNKALTILGPKAAVSGCDLSRSTGEAIVVPAVNDVNGELFHVTSSDVTIKGFTIDGDNPSLPANGYGFNGADMYAAEGVTVYADNVNNLKVENNVFKNLLYYGVTLYGASTSAPATSGHSIKNNKFQDLGTYDPASTMDKWGGGILLYNNQYASVTGNCMNNVRTGIQTGNFHALNPGDAIFQVITNNTIQARRRGVFYNLHTGNPSPLTFSNNTITALANANETRWIGFAFSSLSEAVGVGLNNTINGIGLTIPSVGYEIWNVKNNAPASIIGGSVTNVSDGVFANNFEGYASNGSEGAHATLSNIAISPLATGTGIHLHDHPGSTHAEVKVTIGSGVTISGGNKGVDIDGAATSGEIANATITANANGISVINGGKLTNCSNNFITNNTNNGISVDATAGAIGIISENDLSGNGLKAINNLSVPTITATCNWWGSANDVTSKFSGNVTYYPWLFDGTDNALPIAGFQPVPNSCLNPPVCSITSPVNNFVSYDNESIIIHAQASEPGGNITKVELFLDAVKTDELTTEPYNFIIANPVLGSHVLSVKAFDAYGVYTVSAPVNITVKCSRYDLNNDNAVDVNDFLRFVAAYGTHCSGCQEDFNNDGVVDVNDFLQFVAKYGYSCN